MHLARLWRAAGRALPLAAPLALLLAACGSGDREQAFAALRGRETTPASLRADSAAGDSLAFAALPPALREALDVRALLQPAAVRDTSVARCDRLAGPPAELRHRLRARLPGGVALVVFTRATAPRGELRRVELVRRVPGEGQRGFIWRADEDETVSVEWPPERGAPPESSVLPRGGPAPRALRALGRRLLVLPCAPAADTGRLPHDSANSPPRDTTDADRL